MRLCTLEEHLRPDDLTITLNCSAMACGQPITKGDKYGIRPNTNLIYCASCAGTPATAEPLPEVDATPKPAPAPKTKRAPRPRAVKARTVKAARPKRSAGGQPLPPGQWAKKHARCVDCGLTEHPHRGNGQCQKCRDMTRDARRKPMAARGMACASCGTGDAPHHARGLCPLCWKRSYSAMARAQRTGQHPSHCACFECADARRTQNQRPRGVDWRGMPFAEAVS